MEFPLLSELHQVWFQILFAVLIHNFFGESMFCEEGIDLAAVLLGFVTDFKSCVFLFLELLGKLLFAFAYLSIGVSSLVLVRLLLLFDLPEGLTRCGDFLIHVAFVVGCALGALSL